MSRPNLYNAGPPRPLSQPPRAPSAPVLVTFDTLEHCGLVASYADTQGYVQAISVDHLVFAIYCKVDVAADAADQVHVADLLTTMRVPPLNIHRRVLQMMATPETKKQQLRQ